MSGPHPFVLYQAMRLLLDPADGDFAVISESAEQWGWDRTLAPLLNPHGKMKKWADRGGSYKREFRKHFPTVLAGSEVFAVAMSARGGKIVDSLTDLISSFRLSRHLLICNGEVSVVGVASGHEFSIPIDQASYVLHLLNFICRMHGSILEQLWDENGSPLDYCDWQISPDNFPSGHEGRMAELFGLCASSASGLGLIRGNLRFLTNLAGDPGAEVCDSLAGMLRHSLLRESGTFDLAVKPTKGALYWERHDGHPV